MFDPSAAVSPTLLGSMLSTIAYRGPDDVGLYTESQVGLGHRRLSIIGLGSGHQPLANEDGTVWITFNGEIYNYQDLRKDLQARGHRFATDTDTEVIVHLYEEYGENCVEQLRGMFAFGLWDERKKLLLLARDRVGIKPLYYHLGPHSIVFASEIKAILADPQVESSVDPAMIDRFLTFHYLPGEETLLRNVRKLPPGSYMVVNRGNAEVRQYWDLKFGGSELSEPEAERQLLGILDESVRLHMISDVPVGVLLSGGFDSTAILSLASAQSDRPISSYTVGFGDPGIDDERPYARLAAAKFGTEHHEMTITAADFQEFLPKYVWHMEEPVCEPPAVALYYISKLASNYVKVLLSGEGGDEAFAGYPNYRNFSWMERAKQLIGPLSGTAAMGCSVLDRFLHSQRIAKYAQLLRTRFEDYYYSRTSTPFSYFNSRSAELYSPAFASALSKSASLEVLGNCFTSAPGGDWVNRMLYIDTKTWLPDDLLLKADKITMANSVELRVPLLDHKVLEFAASLPGHYKVRGWTTKYLAKKALSSQVPQEIRNRKKAGFPVPYDLWLRRELKDWLGDLLLDGNAHTRAYFRKASIEQLIAEDLRFGHHAKPLFSLAVLELWHRAFLPGIVSSTPERVA